MEKEDKMEEKQLNKDASDFMLEEYKQIAKALSDLYPQKSNLLKFYITLISIVSTALGSLIVLKSGELTKIGIDYIDLELGQIIGILFGILAIVGGLIMCSAIGLRIEMLMYARTINCVRRYFADKYPSIKKYLVLPIHDEKPPFKEKRNRPFIQEVTMLALLNAILLTVSLTLVFKIPTEGCYKIIYFIILIIAFLGQWYLFCKICKSRESEYTTRCPNFKEEK
jgi:hypothetical protein